MNFFSQLIHNKILMISFVSWSIAQFLKVSLSLVKTKRFDFERLVGAGGMPSSHSAFVMALSTSVGKIYGWASPLFAMAIAFALVVMYDAAGVRRASGKQAEILNIIIKDVIEHKGLKEERLKELIGHTPIEVFVGGLLGIIIANILV